MPFNFSFEALIGNGFGCGILLWFVLLFSGVLFKIKLNGHIGHDVLAVFISTFGCQVLATVVVLGLFFFKVNDNLNDTLAARTDRIVSINAVTTSGAEVDLVVGEDGISSIKALGMDTRAGTIDCEFERDGVRQAMELDVNEGRGGATIVAERWGHKKGTWGVRSNAETTVSMNCAPSAGIFPFITITTSCRDTDMPLRETLSHRYEIPLDSDFVINLEDTENPCMAEEKYNEYIRGEAGSQKGVRLHCELG